MLGELPHKTRKNIQVDDLQGSAAIPVATRPSMVVGKVQVASFLADLWHCSVVANFEPHVEILCLRVAGDRGHVVVLGAPTAQTDLVPGAQAELGLGAQTVQAELGLGEPDLFGVQEGWSRLVELLRQLPPRAW